jgi:TRAP-type C4-dicarboxylate transport system permease small subunit
VKISKFLFFLSQITIGLMMVTTTYDTIMRYFFAKPTDWSVELNEVLLVFITLLAGAELVKRDQHIQMDLIYLRLPEKGQKISRICTSILGILFCVCLVWIGFKATWSTYLGKVYLSGAFRFPVWIMYALIPLGMILMAFEFLTHLIKKIKEEAPKGKEP